MTRDVMVTVSGKQSMGGMEAEQDIIETVHVGVYYERDGTHYLLFDELLEGLQEPVRNIIKIKKDSIEVRKRGPVSMAMLFETGKQQSAAYSVPYGSFLIETRTVGVHLKEETDWLEASAVYCLHINGEYAADCDIRIRVQSRDKFQLV